jgi:hypothetical protein
MTSNKVNTISEVNGTIGRKQKNNLERKVIDPIISDARKLVELVLSRRGEDSATIFLAAGLAKKLQDF